MLAYSGSYTGDGTSSRAITGVGFQPDLVIVKILNGTADTWFRTKDMAANTSFPIRSDAGSDTTQILSLDTNGFTVGSNSVVNQSASQYGYLALKDNGVGDFSTISYTGDAADDKLVFSAFKPDFALIKSAAAIVGAMKFAPQASALANSASNNASMNYQGSADRTDLIYFDNDGLRVSNGSSSGGNLINVNATSHYGFVIKNAAAYAQSASYTGTGTNGLAVTTGFQPIFALIHRSDAGSPVIMYQVQAASGNTVPWDGTQSTGSINSFTASGFTLGTNSNTNNSGSTYWYMAVGAATASADNKPQFFKLF